MDNIFVNSLLTDKIKVQPKYIGKNIQKYLQTQLENKFQGKCTYHGYVKPDSIKIFKYSLGQLQAFSLNGDVVYTVQYYADVCNPSIGSVVQATVVNSNKYGILCESGIMYNGKLMPILEIIIVKNAIDLNSEINIEDIKVGDNLNIEIMGKKFELNDKKISVVGRIIVNTKNKNIELEKGDYNENDVPEEQIDSDVEAEELNVDEDENEENEEENEEDEEESEDEEVSNIFEGPDEDDIVDDLDDDVNEEDSDDE